MGSQQHLLKYYVTENKRKPILGLEAASDLGLVPKIHSINTESAIKVIKQFDDVFQKNGIVKCRPYKINVDPTANPSIAVARKVPLAIKGKLKEELENMVKNGILTPVDEPTEWVHPIVIVNKPDGT